MALTHEERHQVSVLVADGWDAHDITLMMTLSTLCKIPIPAVALLWANAWGDFNELYPLEEDDEVDSGGA